LVCSLFIVLFFLFRFLLEFVDGFSADRSGVHLSWVLGELLERYFNFRLNFLLESCRSGQVGGVL